MTRALRTALFSLVVTGLLLGASLAGTAHAQATQRDVDALSKASLIYIATVRKDGTQSKAAPVWFTTSPNNVVLIQTGPQTWKAKRINRSSPVMIWIGSADGPAFIGR